MGLYRYTNEDNKYYQKPDYGYKDYDCYKKDCEKYPKDHDKYPEPDDGYEKDKGGKDYGCEKDCDPESAKALKKILGLIDELNNEDLKILEEFIERLLCSRKKVY